MGIQQPFDIILVHPPSVFDFREREDILFPYLGNSDGVHVSPIFEMPPVGILALQQHLTRQGFAAEFFNLASHMLHHPDFAVQEFFEKVPAAWIGIDLHWMVHAQGALEIAALYKQLHPMAKVVIGGISATYYHEELVTYPQVDCVLRGYDTLLPLEQLLEAQGRADLLAQVPNLTWKDGRQVRVNPLSHTPAVYSAVVDWDQVFAGQQNPSPYNIVIPQVGCEYNCRYCGGGHSFYRKYMQVQSPIHKGPEALRLELEGVAGMENRKHTVTTIDFWHEYERLLAVGLDVFSKGCIHSVHYSLARLPDLRKAGRMGKPVKAVFELSPDTHDRAIGRACGRGQYSMDQMEAFIDALVDEIYSFEIYFMIGLPHQDAGSVWETVDYCSHLLRKYRGRGVTPYLCPMLPFLDPGSDIFDRPERYGFKIYHRTLQEHVRALESLHLKDRMNYETDRLDRDDLIDLSYDAVRTLTDLKRRNGYLPVGVSESIIARIDETKDLLGEIERMQAAPAGARRKRLEQALKPKVKAYNREQFRRVRSQQRPVDFGFAAQQWFDTDSAFEAVE